MRTLLNTLCAVTVLYVCLDLLETHALDSVLMATAYIIHVLNVSRHTRKHT